MIRIALTGSIGMGKSTTAQMFAEEGIPIWDADAAVHRLYGPDAEGTEAIAALVPGVFTENGVDRGRLQEAIDRQPELLSRIERAIHPLVARDRKRFSEDARRNGAAAVLFDIPLLFETGAARDFDTVVTVSAPAEVQRKRVLARPGMTPERFEAILDRQVPDAEKRARSDFVVTTDRGFGDARIQVRDILEKLGLGSR